MGGVVWSAGEWKGVVRRVAGSSAKSVGSKEEIVENGREMMGSEGKVVGRGWSGLEGRGVIWRMAVSSCK